MKLVSPKISAEKARKILTKRGPFSLRRKREARKMELVYLPYYIYKAVVSQRNDEYEIFACMDGIRCDFSFFDEREMSFLHEPAGAAFDFLVSPQESERACLDSFRWQIIRHGLRSKIRVSIKGIREADRIHYPYWVVYFKRRGGYDFRAADALTGELQGARLRKVLLTAFSAVAASTGSVSGTANSPETLHSTQSG